MSVSSPKEEAGGVPEPLEAIASLERDLSERVGKAREVAEKIIQRARSKADSEKKLREERLAEALATEKEEAMVSYRGRAEEIAASWERESGDVRARAEAGVPRAVELLVRSVLAVPGQEAPR